jgi:transcriptional antiterminator NusG
MGKKWYVVHTYSGYENKVKQALEEKIKASGKEALFGEIIVPSEKVVDMVKGVKKTTSRKFFPGYILVNMEMTNIPTDHLRGGYAKDYPPDGGGCDKAEAQGPF